MKKEQRKALEKEIIASIEQLLSKHNEKATEKVRRHIKDAGKIILKKFSRAVKQQGKKEKTPATSVKKAAAATLKVPAKKAKASKKITG